MRCSCCGTWVITHVVYTRRAYLRVTHRGALVGAGHYSTVAEVWAAVERWGGPPPERFEPVTRR